MRGATASRGVVALPPACVSGSGQSAPSSHPPFPLLCAPRPEGQPPAATHRAGLSLVGPPQLAPLTRPSLFFRRGVFRPPTLPALSFPRQPAEPP